jgi:ankyrin repeat protein
VDIDSTDANGQTALSWAAEKGCLDIVRALVNVYEADEYLPCVIATVLRTLYRR